VLEHTQWDVENTTEQTYILPTHSHITYQVKYITAFIQASPT